MRLTSKQEQGLKIAVERFHNNEPYTLIEGWAGTGKSTLVRFIIDALRLEPYQVAYMAYTGKAAQVLKNKGCPNAITAHRFLYKSILKKDGTFFHRPKPAEELMQYKLIVVDEISMLPDFMWDLLLSYKIYVIALGDPGQLPPVKASASTALEKPHIFLDEIMRQAQESEIIRLTMDIRDGKPLSLYKGKEVRIVDTSELKAPGFLSWADQVICGKNQTRFTLNQTMRRIKYGPDITFEPIITDKLICLHNDWDFVNDTNDALVNGMTGYIQARSLITSYKDRNPFMEKTYHINFLPDYENAGVFPNLEIDYRIFKEGKTTITVGPNSNFQKIPKQYHPYEFDYGYAITCHKAQGSEFNKVIVFEEFLKGTKEEHKKWLYTAATRASEKLIIVKDFRN